MDPQMKSYFLFSFVIVWKVWKKRKELYSDLIEQVPALILYLLWFPSEETWYSKPIWTWSWATCSSSCCLSWWVGPLKDLWMFLSTWTIMWFFLYSWSKHFFFVMWEQSHNFIMQYQPDLIWDKSHIKGLTLLGYQIKDWGDTFPIVKSSTQPYRKEFSLAHNIGVFLHRKLWKRPASGLTVWPACNAEALKTLIWWLGLQSTAICSTGP